MPSSLDPKVASWFTETVATSKDTIARSRQLLAETQTAVERSAVLHGNIWPRLPPPGGDAAADRPPGSRRADR